MIKFSEVQQPVHFGSGETRIAGVLALPPGPRGMVLLTAAADAAHGPAPRPDYLGQELRRVGLATLRLELPCSEEQRTDEDRFYLAWLNDRLDCAADWLATEPASRKLALGLFAVREEAAAALQLAARRPEQIAAVVSSGGRPDLAGTNALARVRAPTLLLVAEDEPAVVDHNRRAMDLLHCEKDLALLRRAGERTQQQELVQDVARMAVRWFRGYLGTEPTAAVP